MASLKQKALFEKLGAPLKNYRWSWGAIRPDGAVFLRVWEDGERTLDGVKFVRVTHHAKFPAGSAKHGYRERLEYVDLIRGGHRCYLIMCVAKDPTANPRKVKSYNAKEVFKGGRVEKMKGDWWVEVGAAVPFDEIAL